MSAKPVRCAIYTRKSHTEGLEQAFNSLDAQREAAIDYIKSLKHEGWTVLETQYDDGGYSGATMDRPALQALFQDIESGAIDLVVVYKVDRLSRSIGDFAQIIKRFDQHGVSFVSVTQQFNTATSMGRLTLNMLLSFAQFERDIAGERIRDKIAASKKKGLWVSGMPPLGYRLPEGTEERKLYVIPEEAELVRKIFAGYIESRSLVALAEYLTGLGHRTRCWKSKRGFFRGGKPLTPKYLYRILVTPTYLGKIVHTEAGVQTNLPGLHDPIIDQGTWDQVHAVMEKQDRESRHRWTHPCLLKRKIRTSDGFSMSPSSVHRKSSSGRPSRIVRYYASQKAIQHGYPSCAIKNINATILDDLVRALILDYARANTLEGLAAQPAEIRDHWLRELIDSVVLSTDKLLVRLDSIKLTELRERDWSMQSSEPASPCVPTCPYKPDVETRGRHVLLTLSVQIKRLDGRRLILSPDGKDLLQSSNPEPREHLVNAIGLAYRWHEELLAGKQLRQLTRDHCVSEGWVRRLLPLTQLGPQLLKLALSARLPPSRTLNDLLEAAQHLDWSRQLGALGLESSAGSRKLG